MARGQAAKQEVIATILSTFENSFVYNGGKEIRIPCNEDGAEVQIKVTLTAAKDNVSPGDDTALPGQVKATKVTINEGAEPVFEDVSALVQPSAEELENVSQMLSALGL